MNELDEIEEDILNEDEEIEVDESKGWKQANSADVERLLNVSPKSVEHKVPIDDEGKIFITLFIRDLPITEQLDMLELFMTFDKKGEAKLKWRQYYAHAYIRMVEKSIPNIKWKQARFYNKKFLKVLMDYLPNPFEDEKIVPGGIDGDTRKNS